tara:strand:+ start:363 stop:2090 length:1728 start_codon:yes stop_codon:yes gene_type:complete
MKYISKLINLIFLKFKLNFFLFIVFTLIAIFFETFSLAALLPVLDFFSSENTNLFDGRTDFILNFFSNMKILNTEYLIIFVILFAFIIKNLFLIYYQYWQSIFTLKIERFLASELYKTYLKRDMIFHIKTHSGTLIRNMSVEIKNVTKSISALLVMIVEILMTFTLILILLYVSPTETILTSLIVGSAGIAIIYFTNNKIKQLSKSRAEIDQRYNKNLIDTFNSINDIKLMNKLSFFSIIHDKLKNKYFLNIKKFALINAIPRPLIEIIIISIIVSFIFLSLSNSSDVGEAITIVGLFGIVGLRLLPAFSRIVVSFQSLKFRYVSFQILYDEFKGQINGNKLETLSKTRFKSNLFTNNINFKNITFNYQDKKIFDNFNFQIKKNRMLFIYGESGSGKSTLLNLLMGLIKPNEGQILLDGRTNIHDDIINWRNIVSYVPQQIYLLDESIQSNIAFGEKIKDIDYQKLREVINLSKLNNFFNENDIGDYKLGEKGTKISGGQMQRIGVARALYRRPEVLLLDESTNGLDYETEKYFLEDLNKLKKNITIVFVSHREHIKDYADDYIEIKKLNLLRHD